MTNSTILQYGWLRGCLNCRSSLCPSPWRWGVPVKEGQRDFRSQQDRGLQENMAQWIKYSDLTWAHKHWSTNIWLSCVCTISTRSAEYVTVISCSWDSYSYTVALFIQLWYEDLEQCSDSIPRNIDLATFERKKKDPSKWEFYIEWVFEKT